MILTEEHTLIRDTARAFAREQVLPHVRAWEAAGEIPRPLLAEMGKLGFLGMTVPAEWGGAGADMVSYVLALEEIAAADGGLSTVMSVNNSPDCAALLTYGSPEQKEKWLKPLARGEILGAFCLTEPQAGSDASNLKTRAVKKGNGWVLNGVKQFITSGRTADMALVFAVTDPNSPKRGISCFIVPTRTPGYRVASVEKKLGQKSSDTCQIAFEDCTVGADALLGEEGDGYRVALANLSVGRIGIAAQAVGMARAAFELARAYAGEREAFGTKIINHQAVQFRLADMAMKVTVRGRWCCTPPSSRMPACHASPRPQWRNYMPRRWLKKCARLRSRSTAGTATSPTTWPRKSGATCGCARSTRAPATCSAFSSAGASRRCDTCLSLVARPSSCETHSL
jgi:butyryl-CoA dehydrogenase